MNADHDKPNCPAGDPLGGGTCPAPVSGGPYRRSVLEAAILASLAASDGHGYDLMDRIRALAGDQVCVDPGSIYRLLRGLEDQGFVESTWQTAESGPSRRVYTMTERGVDALEQLSGSLTHRAEALRRLADTALGSARLYRNAGAKKGLRVP